MENIALLNSTRKSDRSRSQRSGKQRCPDLDGEPCITYSVCFVRYMYVCCGAIYIYIYTYKHFQVPPLSTRPPVIMYQISHNITDGATAIQTNDTTFTFENLDPGTYLFSVRAVNVLGDGEKTDVIAG